MVVWWGGDVFFGGGGLLLLSLGSMDWLTICPCVPPTPPHFFSSKSEMMIVNMAVGGGVNNLKSLCFISRSFLVCLCDAKKGVLAKK
jgi:hypothetical protein